MTKSKRKRKYLIVLLILGLMISHQSPATPSRAGTKTHLSSTRRSYCLNGVWDKLKLKNAPSSSKIRWKSSDKRVVRIQSRIKNGIWYKVIRNGIAKITAICKGKRYICRITVKKAMPNSTPIPTPSDDNRENDSEIPVASVEPGENEGGTSTPEATPTPIPTASPTMTPTSDSRKDCLNDIIRDFKDRYITVDMSDYDKVNAVCQYLCQEFDYQSAQPDWNTMLVTGAGDCFASRVAVYYLCRELGIKAYPCNSYEDHGGCMVRIYDDIYMTITGYGGTKPRKYDLFIMSKDALALKLAQYPHASGSLGLTFSS